MFERLHRPIKKEEPARRSENESAMQENETESTQSDLTSSNDYSLLDAFPNGVFGDRKKVDNVFTRLRGHTINPDDFPNGMLTRNNVDTPKQQEDLTETSEQAIVNNTGSSTKLELEFNAFIPNNLNTQASPPLHHKFLTEIAIDIFDFIKTKGGSATGALLVIAQASLESGYGQAAIKFNDYNLFGVMTLGSDYKRTTSHGKVKDYSNAGKYKGAIEDFYNKIVKTWPNYAELLKKTSFTADDIDKALYTGKYIEWKEERNKTGHLSYNFDNVDEKNKINNNQYGKSLINQMISVKKRMITSLDYQISENNADIEQIDRTLKTTGILSNEGRKKETGRKHLLEIQIKKLEEVKTDLNNVSI